jgi:hypothetical protein
VNHCALTARVATRWGCRAGIVLSQPVAEPDLSVETNAATIASLTGVPVLAELPHATHPGVVAPLLRPLAETLVDAARA